MFCCHWDPHKTTHRLPIGWEWPQTRRHNRLAENATTPDLNLNLNLFKTKPPTWEGVTFLNKCCCNTFLRWLEVKVYKKNPTAAQFRALFTVLVILLDSSGPHDQRCTVNELRHSFSTSSITRVCFIWFTTVKGTLLVDAVSDAVCEVQFTCIILTSLWETQIYLFSFSSKVWFWLWDANDVGGAGSKTLRRNKDSSVSASNRLPVKRGPFNFNALKAD